MRLPAFAAMTVCLGLGTLAWACGSSSSSDAPQCAPTAAISGTGIVDIQSVSGFAEYTLSNAQVEDLFNAGSLTVHAGDADAGTAASLMASDPVVLVHMKVGPDDPGTYDLKTLSAQIAYCTSAMSKLIVANGVVTGCSGTGSPITADLAGTLMVTSATQKKLLPNGGTVSVTASIGSQDKSCN